MGRRLNIVLDRSAPSKSWNYEKALADAVAERDLFLKQYPGYLDYQRQIDRILDSAGTTENRMAVLAVMMETKLTELQTQMTKLHKILMRAATA